MKKVFLATCAFMIWSGCVSRPAQTEIARLSALEFNQVSSVAIAALKGESRASGAFHGYERVSAWRTPNAATAAAIGALMAAAVRSDLAIERQVRSSGEDLVRLHSFCFNPGYAVRLKSDRGTRDFLVCLECDEVLILDDAGHSWQHHLEKAEAGKLAVLLAGA